MSALPPDNYSQTYSYCRADVGKVNLKRCAGCRMVHYCSKGCQKAAWKIHKPRCVNGSVSLGYMEVWDDAKKTSKDLDAFLKYWRNEIHTSALISMNLPNEPKDRLATHCTVIKLEYRDNPPSRAQSLRMTEGKVMTRDELADLMRQLHCTEDMIQTWVREDRGTNTVQTCVIFNGALRFLWSTTDVEDVRRRDSLTAGILAGRWATYLTYQIEEGQRHENAP